MRASMRPQFRERYYKVLKLRCMGLTLAECGKILGVTSERIRQMESKATRLVEEEMRVKSATNSLQQAFQGWDAYAATRWPLDAKLALDRL